MGNVIRFPVERTSNDAPECDGDCQLYHEMPCSACLAETGRQAILMRGRPLTREEMYAFAQEIIDGDV